MPIDPAGPLTQYRAQIDKNETDIVALNIAAGARIDDIGLLNTQVNTNIDAITLLNTQLAGLTVNETEVFRAVSNSTQQPSALDSPIQLTFGAPQANSYFSVDAAGLFTVLQPDNYSLVLRLVFGRTGNPGVANLYARGIVNGVQTVGSIHAKLDDGDQSSSSLFNLSGTFPAGTTFAVELLRSSLNGGTNAGGVFFEPAPLADWQASASCSIVINRRAVQLGV